MPNNRRRACAEQLHDALGAGFTQRPETLFEVRRLAYLMIAFMSASRASAASMAVFLP